MTSYRPRNQGLGGSGRKAGLLLSVALPLLALPGLAAAQSTTVSEVEVVGVTPLSGTGLPIDEVASPVQVFRSQAIEDSNAIDVSRFLQRAAAGVYVNDVQNNPLQPDINYRGYTASPLLGTPQGISVYVDGVRLNQAFGDVVSWDLIPRIAVDKITLIPGTNPLFGLNTLGGALSLQTKSGETFQGTGVNLARGEHGLLRAEAETGGVSGKFNWYGAYSAFQDDGWRRNSPSDADQWFGKVGWSDDVTSLAFSYSGASTDLNGNGLQDQRLLEEDRTSVYTQPDNTQNDADLFNLTFARKFSDVLTFTGNIHHRQIDTATYNGDINDEGLGENLYQGACLSTAPTSSACQGRQRVIDAGFNIPLFAAAETLATTPFPFVSCVANVTLPAPSVPGGAGQGEPYEKCNGLINRSATDQSETGGSGQLTFTGDFGGMPTTFIAGAAYNSSDAHFRQTTQFGFINADHGVTPVTGPTAFADGLLEDDEGELIDNRVDMTGETRSSSLYASNTLDVTPALTVTLSGRYDSTKVDNLDFITPSGPGSVTSNHKFSRFNPAISATWEASPGLQIFGGYSEGSRAPTAIELGCSDPENPCRLPNALAGDPPLNQVITKTFEAGARYDFAGLNWTFDVFHSENQDDILFVADDTSGNGYFKNFGETLRQGASLGVTGEIGAFDFGLNYNYLKATYESEEELGAAGNSSSENEDGVEGFGQEGVIEIEPGDHIPLIPKNVFKANVSWDVTPRFSLSADLLSVSSAYVRGNENNAHEEDGLYYLREGKLDGYTLVNLGADFKPTENVSIFAQIDNAFDTDYETAGQLGFTGFTPDGSVNFRPFAVPTGAPAGLERPQQGVTFYSPGAPRTLWIGIKVKL